MGAWDLYRVKRLGHFVELLAFLENKSILFYKILIILLKIVEKLQKSHKIFAYLKIL